jgi:hypothetical protein
MIHDCSALIHLNPRRHPIIYSVLAQAIDCLALFPRRSPLLERNAVLFLHLTYHLPSICRLTVIDCPVRYWQEVMQEVDAKVEIGDSFCVMLAVHTAPIVVMVSVIALVHYASTVFGVRPFDVQSEMGGSEACESKKR